MTTSARALRFVFDLYLRSWLNMALWPFLNKAVRFCHLSGATPIGPAMLVGLPPGNEFDSGSLRAARASFALQALQILELATFLHGMQKAEQGIKIPSKESKPK
jgi:hypothetical protein